MSHQVSSRPDLLFYPQRCTARTFPPGSVILPSDLETAWNLSDLEKEYHTWSHLNYPFPWAVEIFPDFPWMEALCGSTIRATVQGYSIHPVDPSSLKAELELPEATVSGSPWMATLYTCMDQVSAQWADNGISFAIPSLTGPVHLLVSLVGKESLKKLLHAAPQGVEEIIERLALLYLEFYRKVLERVKPTGFGYVAGGCFLPSAKPLLVLKDPDWMEFQHLLPIRELFYDRFTEGCPCRVFLATPVQALRWLEPCEKCILTDGIIVEKNEIHIPWEDLVPLFRMIQSSDKTLVIAGPPEMEDWEFAQKELEPRNLSVLFYTTSFQEVRFWADHLLAKDRRSL